MTDHQAMHQQWTDLLNQARDSARAGVSDTLLGRVLGRVMLGGGVAAGSVPRIEITKGSMGVRKTTLSPGSVGKATEALRAVGLLTELSRQAGDRGGPVVPLALGDDSWAAIGIHIAHRGGELDAVTGILARLDGREILSTTRSLTATGPDDETVLVDGITGLVRELVEHGRDLGQIRLLGVGLEVGQHVRHGEENPGAPAERPDWQHLSATLAELLDTPVVVENDIHAIGIGAFYHGRVRTQSAVIVEVRDEGVGGALILGGRIYRGGSGMAMEPGHLEVEHPPLTPVRLPSPRDHRREHPGFADPCLCHPHRYGHVEALATPVRICGELGVDDIKSAAETPALRPDDEDPTVFHMCDEGVAFRRAGTALGRGLAHIVNIVNPTQMLLRLPAALAEARPQTSGAEYLLAVERAMDEAFSTGPQDARSGHPRLAIDGVNPADVPDEGARAAAIAVLHNFVEHAEGRDACTTLGSDRNRG